MKSILCSLLFLSVIVSCKKQEPPTSSVPAAIATADTSGAPHIKKYVAAHMPDSLYKQLDTASIYMNKENAVWYYRVAFLQNRLENKFVLLMGDSVGNVSDARIIELDRDSRVRTSFNGTLRVRTISGESILSSTVTNGYIDNNKNTGFITLNSTETNLDDDPVYKDLPVVDIYPQESGDGGIDLGDYYLLLSAFGNYNGYGYSGTGIIGSGSVTYYRASAPVPPAVRTTTGRPSTISVETSYQNPAINVADYFKCFGSVSDAGANYTVGVLVDIPDNDNPGVYFSPSSDAVGHVFLQFTKTNGSQSVTQYMGFTAQQPFSALISNNSVASKIVDNEGHEFNAELQIPVTASGFQTAMNAVTTESESEYNLASNNCVNFALGVVNSLDPTSPLTVQPVTLPGGDNSPMDTPGGLYIELSNIQGLVNLAGGSKITTGLTGNAGASHGPCN